MKKLVAGCILSLLSGLIFGQEFGGHPPRFRWKQINSDSVRVIYPEGLDSTAQRVSSIAHYLASRQPFSLGERLRKINIVLQNQTTIPNGYVGLGPYRSEFFLTPFLGNFDEGSLPWADLLAVHEYRHVQQFNNFNRGLSRLMYYLFGEEGYALAINAAVPDWFYEGDAVQLETSLSVQGRGRLPLFLNAYPALWRAGKDYSWMKLRNGSLKDYVPNHYYLGYLLVNYGNSRYGPEFWRNVTADASAFKGLFYPFQKAVRRHARIDFKTFREQALAHYQESVTGSDSAESFLLPVQRDYVTSYYFPHRATGDGIVYQKNSHRHRPAFYLRDSSGERRIRVRDISLDEHFSYRNGWIAYAAYESHPRWGWHDWSVIKMINLGTGSERKLTSRTRYFSPDLSPDASMVAAVQVSPAGKSEIHILDAADGKIVNRIGSSEIMLFTDPKFVDDSTLVTAVRLKDGRMALALSDLRFASLVRLTPPAFHVIGNPSVDSGVVYFTASFGGNDDLFALRIHDRSVFRLSRGPLGNYFVNVSQGQITWSAFTAEGYQLKKKTISELLWEEVPVEEIETMAVKFRVSGDSLSVALATLPRRNDVVAPYRKSTGLFNFHSWRPYYSDPIFSFSIYGENILNTFQTEIYYLYHQDEKTSAIGGNVVYGGLFPHLYVGSEYTFDREEETGNRVRHWDQLDSYAGIRIPLSFSRGKSFRSFSAGTNYVLRNQFNKGFFHDSLGNESFSYLYHFLSWSEQAQAAVQHIYPKLGYGISVQQRYPVTRFEGFQFVGSAHVYLPGIASTHSLVLTGAFQERDTLGQVIFSNRFGYSRGYTGRYFSRMWRMSGNYHFPLLYPDWGFANLLYFLRLRGNLFYDHTLVYSRDKRITRPQRSAGVELFADTKWWNQYPLSIGVRVSRLLDPDQFNGAKGTVVELVLPVSIIPR